MRSTTILLGVSLLIVATSCGDSGNGPEPIDGPDPLSFFVTSIGTGADGGNYGGLSGADTLCTRLATAAGAGSRTWRAYLSTAQENARDRIGIGPWYNAMGVRVARDVDQLHSEGIRLDGDPLVLDENGEAVTVLEHDIVTGTRLDGRWLEGRTCQDWTSRSSADVAQVGHSDNIAPDGIISAWNSTHESASCTEEGLAERFGAGRIYCFAIR